MSDTNTGMAERDGESLDLAARGFALISSVAAIWHFLPHVHLGVGSAIVLSAALWLFVSGGSSLAWLTLSFGYIALFWSNLPLVPAHEYAGVLVHAIIILAFVVEAVRGRSWRVDRAKLYATMQPMITLFISAMMAWATLYKLNRGFFDLDESWAPLFHDFFFYNLFIPEPQASRGLAPYITIAGEAFIAVGLLFRRTRSLAAMTIYAMWLTIAICGVVTFSAPMFATAVATLDHRFVAETLRRTRLLGPDGRSPRVHLLGIVGWVLSFLVLRTLDLVVILWWLLTFVPLLVIFIRVRRRHVIPFGAQTSLRPTLAFSLLFALMAVNEITPFLGVKDYPVMRMYSNLRVDSCGNNHLFLPAAERPAPPLVTTMETWRSFDQDFRAGRSSWAWNREWLFAEVAQREKSAWDPATFGETVAALAREIGAPYEEVRLVYERGDSPVREDLATFLARERRHPFHRFFPIRPEAVEGCDERVRIPTGWPKTSGP